MKFYSAFTGMLLAFTAAAAQGDFKTFADGFVSGYNALQIPQLELSYVGQLQQIPSLTAEKKQLEFFTGVKQGLKKFDPQKLTAAQRLDYRLIKYETDLNLTRVNLELGYIHTRPAIVATTGIYNIPNGKEWYKYLIKRWVNDDITPEYVYKYGLAEVERQNKQIDAIRRETGLDEAAFYKHLNDTSFYVTGRAKIQDVFERVRAMVTKNLPRLFNNTDIPQVDIKAGDSKALVQTPGYYDNNVFYYNALNNHINKRQIDWLFLHEAVPGHHYQSSVLAQAKVSAMQNLFYYMGFAEGWGAYAEEYGAELGLYRTPYDRLGKLEWGIVRSIRLPLDVGINYYGWTDEQALNLWKKYIKGQDEIALREIQRVRRWPAQVITYKHGAAKLMEWKSELMKEQGARFDIRDFHDRVLSHGSLPFFMIRENVFAEAK
ncbi:DUF885 domain-containing protein [Mucilaginibacter sp. AK015]|uniref:DUF885 domain-containing protein n=1 Tax=Mucilaginibacter sp. AK015 TaxID=2723072 RepID=UPI001611668D|nr:DUF885 domain-containing protein [Mucilaginibacter sp. AK015]MBB5394634.1 uncharacterized protein (DUF885 family) [Mucilaginibacter sp. AK015]